MNQPTLDLFDSDAAPAPAPASAAAADPKQAQLLEDILSDAGRKNAWKAMAPEARDELAAAVAVVARAKRAAYEKARAGEKLSNFGWANREPALADAMAKLHAAFIECGSVPMADA